MLTLRKILLFPFTAIYWVILRTRHLLYDTGVFKTTSHDIPIIGVGNLALGGTGKTPLTCYLIEHFKKNYSVAIISRGYGRSTKGYVLANKNSTSKEIGDEPRLYTSRYPDIQVAVCEDRNTAVKKLLSYPSPPDLIILDDCLQHRAISVNTMLLTTQDSSPFWNDMLLPSGNLRDIKYAKKRANAIVVTNSESNELSNSVQVSTFKSHATFSIHQMNRKDETQKTDHVIFSGIAKNSKFKEAASGFGNVSKAFTFSDHHTYSDQEIEEIVSHCNAAKTNSVVTTEKDYQRLTSEQLDLFSDLSLSILKMEFKFYEESKFLDFIENRITQNV